VDYKVDNLEEEPSIERVARGMEGQKKTGCFSEKQPAVLII
jgi:hypothetical protein